jgi:hypothetical protein
MIFWLVLKLEISYNRVIIIIFWLVLKLEISYNRVIIIIFEGIWFLCRGFFEDYIFAWSNIRVSIVLLFAFRYFLM